MLLTIEKVRNTVGGVVVGVAAAVVVVVVVVVVEMGERAFAGVLDPVGEMMLSTGELCICGKENGVSGVWNGEVRDKEVELDWIDPPDVDWV